ncbi:MAG: phosphotransacetylase family protein [Chloroflexota bacterium]|nr:phosphotransacetylase family protein [Chloroflexota bacterium]
MATIYVASTETFVGKSAICAVLLDYYRGQGRSVGYMKPVSVAVAQTEQGALDQDAQLMREMFELRETPEQIAPVLATTRVVESVLRGEAADFRSRLQNAYQAVSAGKDVVVLEGANTWAEGALLGLSADQVSDILDAPVLLINRFRSTSAVDIIVAVQRYLGKRLIGVILNQVFPSQIDYVRSTVVPFLEKSNVPVLGIVPHDAQTEAATVRDVIEQIGGQVIGDGDRTRLVENLSIGAMSAEAALSYFRRKPNKVVVTGGDRADIAMAALETSTSCVILTGNLRPAATVMSRATERNVPLVLTPEDTLSTVQRLEALMGHLRFGGAKRERFHTLAANSIDWARLTQLLQMSPPS